MGEAPGEDVDELAFRCSRELAAQGYCVLPRFLQEPEIDELRLVSVPEGRRRLPLLLPPLPPTFQQVAGQAPQPREPRTINTAQQEAETLYELAEEERQRGTGAFASAAGVRWGADAAGSCIYEAVPGHRCTPALRTSHAAYCRLRSTWPLRAGVARLLFASRLTCLVTAILGPGAVLFNDQFILKPPERGPEGLATAFAWHRDSDWVRGEEVAYAPYMSGAWAERLGGVCPPRKAGPSQSPSKC